MDRLFRIDFYPQDWLIDTARLTPEERGIYIQIVMMIYANRGPIPNDEKHLANLCGCSTRLVRSIVNALAGKGFVQLSDGKIGQKRAENELNLKRTHLERSSNGGRTSAENKRESKKNSNLDDTGQQNPVGSPSPSPTPTAKDISPSVSPSKRGTRLAADWKPDDVYANAALALGLSADRLDPVAAHFRDYWISKPGKDGVKLDWLATWRNWIRREVDRPAGGRRMPNGKPDYMGGLMGAAQRAAKNTEGV